jgi:hypothetical protein
MTKPSIVIVPGSFAVQGCYQDLVDRLRAKGFPALAIDLLSSQKRLGLEPATMQDDAKHIRAVAETLIGQGKEVVVMCHVRLPGFAIPTVDMIQLTSPSTTELRRRSHDTRSCRRPGEEDHLSDSHRTESRRVAR